MAFYRLISLSIDGGAMEARRFECPGDRDALDAASLLVSGSAAVEVWNGARLIGRLPPREAAGSPDAETGGFDDELAALFHETWQLAEQVDDPRIARRLFLMAKEIVGLRNHRSL